MAREQELAFSLDRQSLTQDRRFADLFCKLRGSPGVCCNVVHVGSKEEKRD